LEFDLTKAPQDTREEEILRAQERDLWSRMLVAVSNDTRVTKIDTPLAWADRAVVEFNKRFGKK
jgi:hypothetical protein